MCKQVRETESSSMGTARVSLIATEKFLRFGAQTDRRLTSFGGETMDMRLTSFRVPTPPFSISSTPHPESTTEPFLTELNSEERLVRRRDGGEQE